MISKIMKNDDDNGDNNNNNNNNNNNDDDNDGDHNDNANDDNDNNNNDYHHYCNHHRKRSYNIGAIFETFPVELVALMFFFLSAGSCFSKDPVTYRVLKQILETMTPLL